MPLESNDRAALCATLAGGASRVHAASRAMIRALMPAVYVAAARMQESSDRDLAGGDLAADLSVSDRRGPIDGAGRPRAAVAADVLARSRRRGCFQMETRRAPNVAGAPVRDAAVRQARGSAERLRGQSVPEHQGLR